MTTDPHPDTIPSVSLLPDWRFFRGPRALAYTPSCEDEHWQPVILPHTWNDEDMAPDRPMLDAYQGVGWYRCRVHLRPQPGERILLRLDAATMEHEVWVDGSHLGGSDCGFLATRHDITEALLPEVEEHCIAVRVSNAPQPGLMPPEVTDWERYGGLIRPVWIERRGDAHFSLGGIALRTTALDTHAATLQITCELREWAAGRDLRIVHRISDPDGATVQELERRIHSRRSALCSDRVDATLPEPLRWSPDAPRLYRVRSELYDGERLLDACEQRIGLRTMVWDAQRGFLLNGERLELVGVNAHQDYPGCGHALPERFHRAEVAAIKAAGLNCLRGAHYPRHEAVLDACDELGVLVIEELPFWHGSCRTQHGQALIDSAGRQARELVRQHGNHPSIIAWNTVNEIMHVPGFHEAHLPPEMRSGKHRLPAEEWAYARRVIGALADGFRSLDDRAVGVVIGGAWKRNCDADVPALADLIGCNGGTFHAGYGDDDWAVAAVHERYPDRAIYLSEGILLCEAVTRADWEHECRAWRTFAAIWNDLFALEWFCGGTMWVWADYSAKGTYRTRGMCDYRRLPLESFHFFRSQGATEPVCHICGHWSWVDDGSSEREVVVFHNGERVELFLDGACIAEAAPDREQWPQLPHPPTVFRLPFRPGRVQARVHRGDVVVCDERISEGPPACIGMELEGDELAADGIDVRFVTATVRDAAGQRCYRHDGELLVTTDGAARHCGPTTVPLRGGLARWALRSIGSSGTYRITADSPGLPTVAAVAQAEPPLRPRVSGRATRSRRR